jgi:hypothetical protein
MGKAGIHPILGTIKLEAHNQSWWTTTEVLPIAGLGFSGRISTFSPKGPPPERQLEAMVRALSVTPEMRREMVERMALEYAETDFYGEGIPKLRTPEDIWSRFMELTVFVSDGRSVGEDNDELITTYAFRLAADPDHEINVECRGGRIVDVRCEG